MYSFRKPSQLQIDEFIQAQDALELSYSGVGLTMHSQHPAGFVVDQTRIRIGDGRSAYELAKRALCDWRHYEFDWIELHRPESIPETGQNVAVVARALGLWVLNACRVVYVLEEEVPLRRFAFAYGTLPEHAEAGEERFQVEWAEDDSVWYDIMAFSRPNQLFSWIAHPLVRRIQKRFARDSSRAMKAAVDDAVEIELGNAGLQ